ncbi:hypothetical protein P3T76_010262 [Phytophthora citrophthora]|uniref:M96 mating-specific protein family n=1 Tax=Phytophthora citrophthora TaxID=4793 RepID=A0AAD9GC26_9STRA|nr:hypothetical protein P3T76_010262 [Phytophthora citrophthora]
MSPSLTKNPMNPTWKRRKEELQCLRKEVFDLEGYLRALQIKRLHDKLLDECFGHSPELQKWKTTALSERKKRQMTDDENKRLKRKLTKCEENYKALQSTLTQASVDQNIFQSPRSLLVKIDFKLSSPIKFTALKVRLDARSQEVLTIFSTSRVDPVMRDSNEIRILREGLDDSTATIEFKDTQLLPFSANKTSSIAWDVMLKLGAFPSNESARVCGLSGELLASEAHFTHPLKCGGSVEVRACCLMKPIAIPGGFMVMAEGFTEWLASPSNFAKWTHVTQDSGWAIVYPGTEGVSSEMCQTQIMAQMRSATADHEQVATLPLLNDKVSDAVVSFTQRIMKERRQLLDNALLDSTLAK